MRLSIAVFALMLALSPVPSISADISAQGLTLSYSRDKCVCKEAAELLSQDKACRPSDAIHCSDEESYSVLLRGTRMTVFQEIATNQYDYTQVYRSIGSSLHGFAVIYVQRFQGDRHPRLVETWKVDASDFDKVLELPPGPIPYEQWIKMKPFPPRETNAAEFDAMLRRGEKVTDEWSPVIDIHGEPYLIERECSGSWAFGGYYACHKVIKLTVKKLTKDGSAVPYCQFVRTKNRRQR
jgi:hypothetical protein